MAYDFTLTPDFAASPYMPMICLVTGGTENVRLRTIHAWMREPGGAINSVIDVELELPFSFRGFCAYTLSRFLLYVALLCPIVGIFLFQWWNQGRTVILAWWLLAGAVAAGLVVLLLWWFLHFALVPRIKPLDAEGRVLLQFPPRCEKAYNALVEAYARWRENLGYETALDTTAPPDNDGWAETGSAWDQGKSKP